MKKDLQVLFYIKKNQRTTTDECPIMGKITVGRTMVQFSCKLSISDKQWQSGRATGKGSKAIEINRELDRVSRLINTAYTELAAIHEKVTAEQVKQAFQCVASEQNDLIKYFEAHNAEFAKRVGVNREPSTSFEYQNSLRHTRNFLAWKYKLSEISFHALDLDFIESFDFYLKVILKRKPNSIIGITVRLRRMIKLAISDGIITSDPFDGYSPERPKPQQKYLTREELEKIKKTPLDHPNRYLVRDMFLFSCYTGLAYRDMVNLKLENLIEEEDGSITINTTRQKTGTPVAVPLLELPLNVIEKYRHLAPPGRLLLMQSCKRMNINLQKIGRQCGIERKLIFHMGRHTYASEITLSQGVPIESVSRMLGHRDLRSTRVYAKITHEKIDEDMVRLQENMDGEFNHN